MTVLRIVASVAKETTVSKNLGSFSGGQGKAGSQYREHVGVQVFANLAHSVFPHSLSATEYWVGLSI